MSCRIDVATVADLAAVVASASALVAADAGRYDPGATDLGWATQFGVAYATGLLSGADNLVLVVRDGEVVVGHLAARLRGPSALHPIRVAELESVFVDDEHRGRGVGRDLVERFLAWAVAKGAQRASVTAYAANEGAQRFYARYGFAPASVTLHRELES